MLFGPSHTSPLVPDPGRSSSLEGGRRSVGVTGRLIALVMIPVTVMCGLAVSEVVARQSVATEAVKVDRGVIHLSALVELHAAVESQQAVEEFGVRVAQVGVTEQAATAILGVDLRAETIAGRGRATRALAVLGPSSPVSSATLQALYASLDDGGLTPAEAVERFGRIENSVRAAVNGGVTKLQAWARSPRADARVAISGRRCFGVAAGG